MNPTLVGLGAIVVAALIYFAGVQRGRRYREDDLARDEADRNEARRRELETEKQARVQAVVDRYRQLVVSGQSSNLRGMLKAGVVGLRTGEEVGEACRLIDREGLTPAIPRSYQAELGAGDLLVFFQLLKEHAKDLGSADVVRQLARRARDGDGV